MPASTIRDIQILNHALSRRLARTAPQNIFSGAESLVLSYLFDHFRQEIYQKDIEAEFDIRPATASELLGRMEKKGLISRRPSRTDSRRKPITLTPEAVHYRTAVYSEINSLEHLVENGISAQDMAVFSRVLHQMVRSLNAD
jgi:DNA-binding MarR family transcriptional regulator